MLTFDASAQSSFRIELQAFPIQGGFSKWIDHGREQLFQLFTRTPDYRRVFCMVVAIPSPEPQLLKTDLFWWEDKIPGDRVALYHPNIMLGFIASFPVEDAQATTYVSTPTSVGLALGSSRTEPLIEVWDVAREPFGRSSDPVVTVAVGHQLRKFLKKEVPTKH